MAGKKELLNLIKKYNQGTASPEEIVFLEKYYQYFSNQEKISNTFSDEKKQELSAKIFSGIQQHVQGATAIPIYKRSWFRAAAAVLFIMLSVSTYLILNRTSENIVPKIAQVKNDIAAPAASKAVIRLANGQTVSLDSLTSGTLATQGNTTVLKTKDGQVIYNGSSSSPFGGGQEGALNTLSNPRGSKVVNLNLADGSRVWLNAGSSITYPVAFNGKDRKVSITGEAYFEVTHNAKMPFTVSANGVDVHDLGTSFNVSAYNDESEIKVTLLEGAVNIMRSTPSPKERAGVRLKPGQQAIATSSSQLTIDHSPLTINPSPDLAETMAWKDNRFYFMSADIKTIARQLSRWYGIDVNVEGNIPDHFTGVISRNVNASEVFSMLQKTGTINVAIEGNKVTIKK